MSNDSSVCPVYIKKYIKNAKDWQKYIQNIPIKHIFWYKCQSKYILFWFKCWRLYEKEFIDDKIMRLN